LEAISRQAQGGNGNEFLSGGFLKGYREVLKTSKLKTTFIN
jgi:hypothetical protein